MSIIIHNSYNDIDLQKWKKLVTESETASFFQSPECYDFYSSLSFLKPFVYGVSENEALKAAVCGYVISDGNAFKRFFSRRAIIPGGVLIDKSISGNALQKLLVHLTKSLSKQAIYIEIRNYHDYSNFRDCFQSANFDFQSHLNFHVPTMDADSALMQLNTTKRRDVRLSRKEGAEWLETTEPKDVDEFYEILQKLYRIRIKVPLFPKEFFQQLISVPSGKLFVVKYKGDIIGGSVCVILPNAAVYEWFVCGLDGKYKNVFPSTVATWAGIEYAASNGFKYFDMMGAGKPDEGYGVREFKSKFGGKLVEHGRYLYICSPVLYRVGKKAVELLKRR